MSDCNIKCKKNIICKLASCKLIKYSKKNNIEILISNNLN